MSDNSTENAGTYGNVAPAKCHLSKIQTNRSSPIVACIQCRLPGDMASLWCRTFQDTPSLGAENM
jgi:hypothetical protein